MQEQKTFFSEAHRLAFQLHQLDLGITLSQIKQGLLAGGAMGLLTLNALEQPDLHPVLAVAASVKPFWVAYMTLGWGYVGEQYSQMRSEEEAKLAAVGKKDTAPAR